jgi:hypothetical protein
MGAVQSQVYFHHEGITSSVAQAFLIDYRYAIVAAPTAAALCWLFVR